MKSQNYPPLTEKASQLFRELVDVNWEIKEHSEAMDDNTISIDTLIRLNKRYVNVQQELIEEMGEDHYNYFIAMGRKMFA